MSSLRAVPDPPAHSATSQPEPHDTTAEQCVLGAMMLASEAITAVTATVDGDDFYGPAHGPIFHAIVDLHHGGDPADAVTVSAELSRRGQSAATGGAPYLHTLLEAVPSAANASHYAKEVKRQATRRGMVRSGTRIAQLGYAEGDVDESYRRAEAELAAAGAEPGPQWPDPIPLSGTHTLPDFPADALPRWVGMLVAASSDATQTPLDLAGCIALAALSTAASGRATLEVRPGWREPLNLYTVVALPPGNRKSQVFEDLTAPLREVEEHLLAQTAPRIREAHLAKRIADNVAEKAAQEAEKVGGTTEAVADATDAAETAANIEIPTEPQLIADDITPEALGSKLAEQGGRLALLADEGGIFATIAGRYSGVPNMDALLKAHSGGTIRVDRRGRPSEHVKRASLTLGLAVQPDVLRDLAGMPGSDQRGLMARVLYALPESTIGHRQINPPPVPADIHGDYAANLRALTYSMRPLDQPAVLTLTPEAHQLVTDHETEVEPKLAPDGEYAAIAKWASKYVGAVCRIAGLLHVAEHLRDGWGRPVRADTIRRAITLGRYFTAHALATFDQIGADPTTHAAHTILTHAQKKQLQRFQARDLLSGLPRSQFRKIADLEPALNLLIEHGWLARHDTPPKVAAGHPRRSTTSTPT